MRTTLPIAVAASLLAAPLLAASPSSADDTTPTKITLTRWTSDADFRAGTLDGLAVKNGRLTIAKKTPLATRSYTDPFGDGTPRIYDVGTWTSPVS